MITPSSQLRDLDLVKWLDNKLGNNNELWSGRQAASLLSREMLVELETCFQALEPHVKLKIVLAIPHLSYRLMTMWKEPLLNLLELARRDADDWVETVSDMYRDYPHRRCVVPTPSNPDSYFCRTLEDMRIIIRKHACGTNMRLLPLDVNTVCQSAIRSRYGISEMDIHRHFNLKRRARSSMLKAELVKSAEALPSLQKVPRNTFVTPCFPIRMRSTLRKPNNELPMRGIPPTNTCKLSAGFTNEPKKFQRKLTKREGGSKLIDIGEIPHAVKRKRRELDAEDKCKKLLEKGDNWKHAQSQKSEKDIQKSDSDESYSETTDKKYDSLSKNTLENESYSCAVVAIPVESMKNSETPAYADVRERPTVDSEHSPLSTVLLQRVEPRELAMRRQCDEMLSSANALDVQGHQMVSDFMAGSKIHPFPHMGDIVTLKLSEMYEDELRPDGSTQKHRVETFFQMDYRTGEWKRLRKTRALRPEEVASLHLAEYRAVHMVLPQIYQ